MRTVRIVTGTLDFLRNEIRRQRNVRGKTAHEALAECLVDLCSGVGGVDTGRTTPRPAASIAAPFATGTATGAGTSRGAGAYGTSRCCSRAASVLPSTTRWGEYACGGTGTGARVSAGRPLGSIFGK